MRPLKLARPGSVIVPSTDVLHAGYLTRRMRDAKGRPMDSGGHRCLPYTDSWPGKTQNEMRDCAPLSHEKKARRRKGKEGKKRGMEIDNKDGDGQGKGGSEAHPWTKLLISLPAAVQPSQLCHLTTLAFRLWGSRSGTFGLRSPGSSSEEHDSFPSPWSVVDSGPCRVDS